MGERRPNLLAGLNKMQDFYMELKWDFHSWCEYELAHSNGVLDYF